MKKKFFSFVLSCFLVLVSFKSVYSNSYDILLESRSADTTILEVSGGYSHLTWTGYKIGSKHTGKIEISKGNLVYVDKKLVGGNFEIDINSISNTDLTDEAMNAKLVNHLKSSDFFDAEKHPTATFTIEKAIYYGAVGENESKYKIVGKLSLKGITKTLKFETTFYDYETSVSISGRLKLDRSDFDIRYGSGSFFDDIGDKIIYDDKMLDISMAALK